MVRILHVDDDCSDVDLFRVEMRHLFPHHEIVSFYSLPEARQAIANGEHFDLFVCDSEIHDERGEDWARELIAQGHKVFMLSNTYFGDIPSVSKGDEDKMIRMIEELLAKGERDDNKDRVSRSSPASRRSDPVHGKDRTR